MADDSTVFIVDDDQALCETLRLLFASVGLNIELHHTARSFLANHDPEQPGCLLLDVRLPGMSGLELLEHLHAHGNAMPVIVMTAYADVSMAVRAMKSGAVEFLEKPFADQVLLDCVYKAIERDLVKRRRRNDRNRIAERVAALTPREREVMDLVVLGAANKQVAAKLGCSGKTVEMHRSRVMRKMEADGIADLVRMALMLEPIQFT